MRTLAAARGAGRSVGARGRTAGRRAPATAAARVGKTRGCRGCVAVPRGPARAGGRLPTARRPRCGWCWAHVLALGPYRRVLLRSTSCSCNVSTCCWRLCGRAVQDRPAYVMKEWGCWPGIPQVGFARCCLFTLAQQSAKANLQKLATGWGWQVCHAWDKMARCCYVSRCCRGVRSGTPLQCCR